MFIVKNNISTSLTSNVFTCLNAMAVVFIVQPGVMRKGHLKNHSKSFNLMSTLRNHTNCITGSSVIRIMVWLLFELCFYLH